MIIILRAGSWPRRPRKGKRIFGFRRSGPTGVADRVFDRWGAAAGETTADPYESVRTIGSGRDRNCPPPGGRAPPRASLRRRSRAPPPRRRASRAPPGEAVADIVVGRLDVPAQRQQRPRAGPRAVPSAPRRGAVRASDGSRRGPEAPQRRATWRCFGAIGALATAMLPQSGQATSPAGRQAVEARGHP